MSSPIEAATRQQGLEDPAFEDAPVCMSPPQVEKPPVVSACGGSNTVEVYRPLPGNGAPSGPNAAAPTSEPARPDTVPARAAAVAYSAFDAALRDGYKATNVARSSAALELVDGLRSSGDASAAGAVARSVSELRNILREATQGQQTPAGKALSQLLEQNREWGAIVEKYGNPFDEALSAEQRFAVAESIIEGAAKSSKVANAVQALGKGLLVLNAAQAGWQMGKGVDELARGRVGEGAIDVGEGTANLGLTAGAYAATKAGLLTGEAGVVAGGLTLAAGAAAAGSVALAAETARAAVNGGETPVEVADKYYGTHFSDIYQWQKESTAARGGLGVATLGLSEAWFALNRSVE
jgi:hypothetical protein